MRDKSEVINHNLVLASFLLISLLAVIIHLSAGNTMSLITLVIVIFVALSNVIYIYRRYRTPKSIPP